VTKVFGVTAGKRPLDQAAQHTLTQWANDCERSLLGLHCGEILNRARHASWASSGYGEGLQKNGRFMAVRT